MSTRLTPYLSFDGNTREVFAFYAQALGGTIEAMISFADMPAPPEPRADCGGMPPPPEGVMHARLALPGGHTLFGGDTPPGMPYDGVKGVMLALEFDTVDEAQRVFEALSTGGRVTMPMAPSFWAKTFGMLTDRYGVGWAVNGESIPLGTPAK